MLDATFRRGTKHAYVAPPTFARVGTLRNEWSMPAVPPLFDFDPKKVEIKQKDGTTLEAMAKTRYVVKAQTRLPNGTQVSFEAPFSLEVTNPAAVRALAA